MKGTALIFALATAHVVSSSALPSAETLGLLAANEVDPQWEFPTDASGPVIKFNGTVEALYAYVSKEYPSYIASVFEPEASMESLETREDASGFLERRTDFSSRPVSCQWLAYRSRIKEGIDYLRRVKGRPSMQPDSWSRVSCSYNAAISWINTSRKHKTLGSFGSIADGAQHLHDKCNKVIFQGGRIPVSFTGGRVDHQTQWAVSAHKGDC